ncbi:MAG: hypothetical protein P1U86_00035 [Verrucomicrobiales bacterium]|nr:hypothetical protein [Verrucomicrobiales bacterium]
MKIKNDEPTMRMTSRPPVPRDLSIRAWTFVEMLVAIALSAIFLGAATLVYQSITINSKRLTTILDVNIGEKFNLNFYGVSGDVIRTYSAPNYGKAALVQEFRDMLLEDCDSSNAVFCLPRNKLNTLRPEFFRYAAGDPGSTVQRPVLDSPESFRTFLASVEPTSTGIYDASIRTTPPTTHPSTTIYMLSPETNPGYIRVHAIWEIDFITPTNLAGTYASVRRYKNNTLTDFYDTYFSEGTGDPFFPLFATFERASRQAVSEGTAIDRFKVARGNPFYMIWLPDPANNFLKHPPFTGTDPVTSPRQAYEGMTGRTSFTVAIPMFPNL